MLQDNTEHVLREGEKEGETTETREREENTDMRMLRRCRRGEERALLWRAKLNREMRSKVHSGRGGSMMVELE